MSQIYLGEKLIASTEGSDIKYDENTSVKEKIDELNSNLTNENSETFNFGVKDGVRGYYTNPSRADDCFVPFKQSPDYDFGTIDTPNIGNTNHWQWVDFNKTFETVPKVYAYLTNMYWGRLVSIEQISTTGFYAVLVSNISSGQQPNTVNWCAIPSE